MNRDRILDLLKAVRNGVLTPEEAADRINDIPFEDLGYAKVDHHRELRQGVPEVIYGQGKTDEQIAGILKSLLDRGGENILVTRISPETARALQEAGLPVVYHPVCRLGVAAVRNRVPAPGLIAVATGGTADIPVAEEAAVTAETLGNRVERLYDVGVAGLHRLLAQRETLAKARVVVAVAGMEGALASVIGGLVACPVIAVPTSVGYGANFGGLSALLAMLNSCASGVSVVNIDNGFGAGYLASRINRMEATK
jgi:NCAIR mutase (PurE)-related protein